MFHESIDNMTGSWHHRLISVQFCCFYLALDAEDVKDISGSDEKPPLTQQSRVSFAEGTTFEKGDRACRSRSFMQRYLAI